MEQKDYLSKQQKRERKQRKKKFLSRKYRTVLLEDPHICDNMLSSIDFTRPQNKLKRQFLSHREKLTNHFDNWNGSVFRDDSFIDKIRARRFSSQTYKLLEKAKTTMIDNTSPDGLRLAQRSLASFMDR